METISYNKEILTATGEMIRLFSNISIFQFHDADGNTISPAKAKRILVPLKYAQTSRILKSIMNPTGEPQEYPIITLEKNDFKCDLNRNHDIHHDMSNMCGSYDPNTHPPIPIDINFKLSIFAKYPEDVDMIVGNFAPWFNSDVFVTSPHPKLNGKYLNHQVQWDGNVNYTWNGNVASKDQDVIVATTQFTFNTELFAGYEKLSDDKSGVIYNVVFDFSKTGHNGELYPEYDENARREHGNIFSGFYCVPYSKDFDDYADEMISNTLTPQEIEYDAYSFNVFNEQFNSAVINCDYDTMTSAAASGANIYKHSYWPYAYASSMSNIDEGYSKIVQWLDNNGSLKPSGEHFPPKEGVKIKMADLS